MVTLPELLNVLFFTLSRKANADVLNVKNEEAVLPALSLTYIVRLWGLFMLTPGTVNVVDAAQLVIGVPAVSVPLLASVAVKFPPPALSLSAYQHLSIALLSLLVNVMVMFMPPTLWFDGAVTESVGRVVSTCSVNSVEFTALFAESLTSMSIEWFPEKKPDRLTAVIVPLVVLAMVVFLAKVPDALVQTIYVRFVNTLSLRLNLNSGDVSFVVEPFAGNVMDIVGTVLSTVTFSEE
jgi:hypothetical protein